MTFATRMEEAHNIMLHIQNDNICYLSKHQNSDVGTYVHNTILCLLITQFGSQVVTIYVLYVA